MTAIETLISVLCDPEGKCCISGSDDDRRLIDSALAELAQAAQQAPAGVTLRSMIEGMSVSVDVSTGDHDAGHRYFGTVTEVMECQGDKHGVTLLVQDAEPNFAAPTPQAAQPALATQQAGIPGNFITHRAAWREALETAKFVSTGVDRSYWDHELAAFDRSFDRLWALMQDAPHTSPTAQAADGVTAPAPPPECETEAEKRAFAFGWFKALKFYARRDKKATVTLLFPGHEAADAWVRGIKGGQHVE